MTAEQLQVIKTRTLAHERAIAWLYRDSATEGNATCGAGHVVHGLAEAERLPFRPPITAAEWARLMSEPRGCRAEFYQSATQGRLTPAAMDALLDGDIAQRLAAIRVSFPEFDQFPEGPQAALFDMAYNVGLAGLQAKFPHLWRAAKLQDWATCAGECHRQGISAERNTETAALFLSAIPQPVTT